MTLPRIDDNDRDLLLEEFRAAWTHYRHLETLRAGYLATVVATYVAVLGVVGTLLRSSPDSSLIWLVVACLLGVLSAVAFIVRGIIRAQQPILLHYADVIQRVRMAGYRSNAKDWDGLFNARYNPAITSRPETGRVAPLIDGVVGGAGLAAMFAGVLALACAVVK